MNPLSPIEIKDYILPIELTGKDRLIQFINQRCGYSRGLPGHYIEAVGVIPSKENWELDAQEVLDMFISVGWEISNVRIFFSFTTRVEFNIKAK